ncbi:hypothetical protein V8687_23605 (plasmid) [Shewanella baltica]|uniref:hypothetical protein n=1 Tax=Shewanella baltica TaxID=62322 RepID=UPI0030D60FC1
MARNKVVQVPCESKLYAKISAYRNSENLSSDANSVRQLVAIGLRSLEVSAVMIKPNQPSERELLESILFHVTKKGGDELVSLD